MISVDLISPCGIYSLARKISLGGESLTHLGVTELKALLTALYGASFEGVDSIQILALITL